MRAAIFTPVRPSDAFLARLSDDGGLPIPLVGRLSRLIFSRPRRCSLLLRPAWPADPQKQGCSTLWNAEEVEEAIEAADGGAEAILGE